MTTKRIRVTLDDELVRAIDERVGPEQRGAFIAESVREAVRAHRRRHREELDDLWAPDRVAWAREAAERAART